LKNVNAAAFATLEQSLTSVELHTDYWPNNELKSRTKYDY
jgi:hypothetical protein